MTTLLISDPLFLDHAMPAGHPERPDRLRAVERVLGDSRFAGSIGRRTMGTLSLAELVHPAGYVEEIAASRQLRFSISMPTPRCHPVRAYGRAGGDGQGPRAGSRGVMSGAFSQCLRSAATRHHAERETA